MPFSLTSSLVFTFFALSGSAVSAFRLALAGDAPLLEKKLPRVACPFSFLSTLIFSFDKTGGRPSILLMASFRRKTSRSRWPLTVGILQLLSREGG